MVDTGQEYVEVCFAPNWVGYRKHGPVYRYLAIREPLEQQALCGMEDQVALPFSAMDWGAIRYKVTGIVTSRNVPADELIWWHRGRCGKSEQARSIMKVDLAGGKLPSGLFGASAAWWQIMICALNVNSAMKRLVLGESWETSRLKAIRFRLINMAGRVFERGRQLFARLAAGHPSNQTLFEARRGMACLCDSGGDRPGGKDRSGGGERELGGMARSETRPNRGDAHTLFSGVQPTTIPCSQTSDQQSNWESTNANTTTPIN